MNECVIVESAFHRFVLVNAHDSRFAWSGSAWVRHVNGIATGVAQVANFDNAAEAQQAAFLYCLKVTNGQT